jgi:energy-coupling factor transport system ATP-binding protein
MCGLLIGRHEGDVQGSVQVGGQDVAATPLHRVAQTIGLVQQNPETHFATLTVNDELAFGMENRCLGREEIRERSARAMDLLSITHLRDRSLATLSGGEKQRVAVASIVAGKPEVLILDEPTASLDPEASRDLFHALADLCHRTGLTVVIVEHKLAHLLPLKPRLICLEEGRIQADTTGSTFDDTCPQWLTGPKSEPVDDEVADSQPNLGEPLVEMSHVTVELGGHEILDDVSLQVRGGEVLAVLGPNGGGKTTLLHSLLGLVQPACGSIRACGVEVSPTAVSRLAKRIGLVFQNADHQLVADTVWREALFAVHNLGIVQAGAEHEATRLLGLAGLSDRTEDHPYRLSWGQKRRLNLISVILHRPQLLLLDEPFAGQDWENVAFLLEAILAVLGGSAGTAAENEAGSTTLGRRGACLMVTHDPRVVMRSCTRLLFVSDGRVAVDAAVPEAFDRLLELNHDAYVPA